MQAVQGHVFLLGVLSAFLLLSLSMIDLGSHEDYVTGMAVSADQNTGFFAPPYDAFTGRQIISLNSYHLDTTSFHAQVEVNHPNAVVYHKVYYYTNNGWQEATITQSNQWLINRASISIGGEYTDHTFKEGDDFFVAVWTCKGMGDEWKCGCKSGDDCGYWHVQGVDLEEHYENEVEEECDPELNASCVLVLPGEEPELPGEELPEEPPIQEPAPHAMFFDGFETGDASVWEYLNPTSIVSESMPHTGQYSLLLRYTPGFGELKSNQYITTTIPPSEVVFARWYAYFDEDFVHPLEGVTLNTLEGSGSVWLLSRQHQGNPYLGRISVVTALDEVTTSAQITNGGWICFEVRLDTNSGRVSLWVDEQQVLNEQVVSGASIGLIDRYTQGGNYPGGVEGQMHIVIDDVVLDTERIRCS